MKKNRYGKNVGMGLLLLLVSACNYLDVVPDKTQEVTLMYERRESALRALATCYHYMPLYDDTYALHSASDEMIMDLDRATPGKQVVLGRLTADYPILGYWNDTVDDWGSHPLGEGVGTYSAFKAIRVCNEFLENIGRVPDMGSAEKARLAAEVKFLKAYYHFLLFQQYGPIPIVDSNFPIDAAGADLMPVRRGVDEVVAYIVGLLDEAFPALPEHIVAVTEYGRIDQVICAAFKGKVRLFAASPLFNNNPQYAAFAGPDGTRLFPTGDEAAEQAKWVAAADALGEAVALAERNGIRLYTYAKAVPAYDAAHYENDPRLPFMYNYQYALVDKWNEEVVWGLSRVATDWREIQRAPNYKSRQESSTGDAWQWFSVTMNAADFFYTENGLPMEEDPAFDYEGRYDLVTIPDDYAAVAIPGEQTVKAHLNREPRFYASIGFDRSRVRGYGRLYDLRLRFTELNGRRTEGDTDCSISGYFLRKVVHPDTRGDGTIVRYPWPIIRLGGLYLEYAEALNEAYPDGSRQEDILQLLNRIRSRAGLPSVQDAWSRARLHPDWYRTREGLREIIRRERTVELAFEGQRNEDVRRWLQGVDAFNAKIRIWNVYGTTAADFYQEAELTNMRHVFTQRNYLWPIPSNELVNNTNLVQNPGY